MMNRLDATFRELVADLPIAARLEARRVLCTPLFDEALDELAQHLGQPKQKLRRQASRCLLEMVALDSRAYRWLWDHTLSPLHTRAFSIDVDSPALVALKKLNEKVPLVFLPSHRSYADPFLTTKVMRQHGLQRAHILGGDNLKFFPFAQIAQHSGGIFIRRSFHGDEVYKAALRAYLMVLIGRGENLEWYMEGGRSRTGKLRPPKYGLMTFLVDAVRTGVTPDVMLVPTSITYDQLHEVGAMAHQEMSGIKPKEGLPWLVEYARAQQKWIGQVHVRFGEPMSLARRLADDAAAHGEERPRWQVEKTAFEVFRRINAITPVTAQAVVTLALLAARNRALTLGEVHAQLGPLLDYAHARSLPVSHLAPLHYHHGMLATLDTLARTRVVERFDGGEQPVFRIAPGQHSVAAFYRNSAVHWFVNRALLELAIWQNADRKLQNLLEGDMPELMELRDLFKFEFFFADKQEFGAELQREAALLDPAWPGRDTQRENRLDVLRKAPFLIAQTVLPTFLEAYYVVADRLAASATGHAVDRTRLLDECMTVGRQYVLQQRIHHPECLSRELFNNALRLADTRSLLGPGGEDLTDARSAFLTECRNLVAGVEALAQLQRQPRRGDSEHAAN
ncbi:MAG: glycerol-3-phosphate acyltransferase [Nevskiaceae bacterium]|nr:MAG: glycerol-3-phosphate acyltransferase [Nevskiaceae bacterium]TBR71878.1 MAG: glycerol-3-phosphate acyltransferase [Nevskiaceae bacterium]